MTGTRLAIALLFFMTVLFDPLRDQMHWVVLVLIAATVAVVRQAHQVRTRRLRDQNLVDLAVFLTVIPTATIAGFVAAGGDEPLPAERSAFLQLSVATIAALGIVVFVSIWLFGKDPPEISTMVLPAVLITISLPFVLHDYRNQTVLAMVTVSYFLSAVAIPFGNVVDETIRRYIGAMFAAVTVLGGLLLIDPGLGNLGDRAPLFQIVTWAIILLGLIVLVALPHVPAYLPGLVSTEGRSGELLQTIRDRRGDDSSRPVEE